MSRRIKEAWNKLIFCWNISDSVSAFFTLIVNTKRYKWNKVKSQNHVKINDTPVKYALRFNNKKRTIFLRTYAGDLDIFYEIFYKKAYAFSFSKNAEMIMDAGANIGLATIYFLNQFPDCKVISVEPDPTNVEVFKKNLAVEIKKQKIFLVEGAIGLTDGFAFMSSAVLKYNSKILEDQKSFVEKIDVKVISMNNFFKQYSIDKIDILKIDIEGSEIQLFTDDVKWLERVKEIVMEVHSARAYHVCTKALLDYNFIRKNFFNESFPQIGFWVKK